MDEKQLKNIADPLLKAAGIQPDAAPFDISTLLNNLSSRSISGIDQKEKKAAEIQNQIDAIRQASANQGSGNNNLGVVAALGDAFFNTPGKFTGLHDSLKKRSKDNTGTIYNLENQLLGYRNSIAKDQNNLFDVIKDYLPKDSAGFNLGDKKALADHNHDLKMRQLAEKYANTKSLLDGKPKKEKTAKATEFAAAGYGKRMKQSQEIFDKLVQKGYNRANRAEDIKDSRFVPGELKGADLVKQNQAERNFVNAVLRRESGAAIAASEFESAAKQYFPRPGDDTEVLKQKKRNREQVIENMRAEAGNAWGLVDFKGERVRGSLESGPAKEISREEKIRQLQALGL